MEVIVGALPAVPGRARVEVVERKGRGHPDTICDHLAERLSARLAHYYLEHFGSILHHNVDKVLLRGGQAEPRFGGGEVTEPIEVYFAGRATEHVGSSRVPIGALCREVSETWFRGAFRNLDPARHVRVHNLIRRGSADLSGLFGRRGTGGSPLANDTSCGVGFAPLSELERVVLAVEHALNEADFKDSCPGAGEDVKVMGIRRGDVVELIVACAVVDQHTPDAEAYQACKEQIAAEAVRAAARETAMETAASVNAADVPPRGQIYLTVTGTSAEAGDDGEAGRGNRANGLITPYRPMTLESVAGKNPVTHVGKLYNVAARRAAKSLVAELPDLTAAEVYLVSCIGAPIAEPSLVELRLDAAEGISPALERRARDVVAAELRALDSLWSALIEAPAEVIR